MRVRSSVPIRLITHITAMLKHNNIPRLFFVSSLFVWLYLFASVRSVSYSNNLRGGLNSYGDIPIHSEKVRGILPNTRIVPYNLDHAIIVPGHAVMKISKQNEASFSEDAWYLLPYQLGMGFPSIIASHVRKGLDILREDDSAMLILSGGQTRHDVGPISEAASYYFLAAGMRLISDVEDRIFLEEYARDSFENLLFSVARFREVTGRYPSKISVVGFDFKSHRFTALHRKAISFPPSNFTYVSLRPNAPFDHKKAVQGESSVINSFLYDMYGCHTPALINKRSQRDPFMRTVPYSEACPEISKLLQWCGPELYTESLPWIHTEKDFLPFQ